MYNTIARLFPQNPAPSIFGTRGQQYFNAANENGTYVQNADGTPNTDNMQEIKKILDKEEQQRKTDNGLGGKFDLKG